MVNKKERNTVGVVCMGSTPAGETDYAVLVFIPTNEPTKSFFASGYVEFVAKVKTFLQNAESQHFDFYSIPQKACLIDGCEVVNFEPLSERQKDLFHFSYFR